MKAKVILIISIILIACSLAACAGSGDWVYDSLPGDYEIWRINSEDIALGIKEDSGLSRCVDGSISEFCYNDNYIAAKVNDDYYVIVVNSGIPVGPLTEDEFNALHPGEMCDWISTSTMPDGAHH